jgi:catechol 2,3-dioxygenase-like lactoylglutathione lyase family enzyme
MKIKLTSVMVKDQDKALKFYTEILGFAKSSDMPAEKADGSPWFLRKNRMVRSCFWSRWVFLQPKSSRKLFTKRAYRGLDSPSKILKNASA